MVSETLFIPTSGPRLENIGTPWWWSYVLCKTETPHSAVEPVLRKLRRHTVQLVGYSQENSEIPKDVGACPGQDWKALVVGPRLGQRWIAVVAGSWRKQYWNAKVPRPCLEQSWKAIKRCGAAFVDKRRTTCTVVVANPGHLFMQRYKTLISTCMMKTLRV